MFLVSAPKLNKGRGKTHAGIFKTVKSNGIIEVKALCSRKFTTTNKGPYFTNEFDERRVDCKYCRKQLDSPYGEKNYKKEKQNA